MKAKHLLYGILIGSLLVAGTAYAKNVTEKISARFANIKLIVNGQVIQTKAEPFIYNGNVYAPVATVANMLGVHQEWDNKAPAVRFSSGNPVPENVWSQANKHLPLNLDYSNPKAPYPRINLLSKNFINMSGKSNHEFLVTYTYTSPEGVPFDSYASLFQYDQGQVKRISTVHLFEGEGSMNVDPSKPGGDVVYNEETKQIYVHRHAIKVISEGSVTYFGKGDLLEASIIEWKDGKLTKVSELKK